MILETFIVLAVLLATARLFGEAAKRIGQSAPVGELLGGVVLALIIALFAADFPLISKLADGETVSIIVQVAIFVLLLSAGIELEPLELRRHSARSLAVALGGMALPLAAGFALGLAVLPESPLLQIQALVLGVAMSITAIPATIRVLEELGLMHSDIGRTIVSAALIDDILGIVLLAILTGIIQEGRIPELESTLWLLARVALFFVVTGLLGSHVYPHITKRLRLLDITAMEISALIIAALLYGAIAEALGLHWILGAFMAGLFFEPQRVGWQAHTSVRLVISAIASGVLGPLFFLSIGLSVELAAIVAVPLFVLVLVLTGFLGKFLGAALPALAFGFDRWSASAVGVGMTSRGAVELVILVVVRESGVFTQAANGNPLVEHLFSALVLMAVINTLIAPMLLKPLGRRCPRETDKD